MKDYYDLLNKVLLNGEERGDRTKTGVKSLFGEHMKFDLRDGFPLLTGKKTHFKSIAHELLWFLSGKTNIKYLQENGVSIWDGWADENGDLGSVYGEQWRSWGRSNIDQVSKLIDSLKNNPESRRHIISAWNVSDLDKMALPPCHLLFQFYVSGSEYLDCQLYQRSADLFLGVPFNIASYSLLMHMVGEVVGLKPRFFHHTIGDAHIYNNHVDQVSELLERYVGESELPQLPQLSLKSGVSNIDDFKYDDIELSGYKHLGFIKAPVAI